MHKRTLVIGASEKPERYSNKAVKQLIASGHEVIALGRKIGQIDDQKIITEIENINDIHTITVYVGINHQGQLVNLINEINPKRVIFNPGTENENLCLSLNERGIECINACTLVMLSIGDY